MQSDRHARSDAGARPDGTTRTAPDPLLGRLLDRRYRIVGRIARGGMATVYRAHDERLDRTVALKVMHPGMGDDHAFAARFVREARAAAKLTHPHVVGVYDQGDDEGVLFLAMELVPGETLRDVIARESPMSPQRALALLDPVLAALAAAHRAGLMHRDVKPENVLIGRDGEVKVADFGLARAVTAETQHTSTGVLIGTVSYIAPELVTEGRADARADVYSAGVMLFEMLTGAKPHTGESPIQVAYKHVHDDVPPPSRTAVGIPAYVDALVARATTRDPALRPADASVMLHQAHLVARALADGVVEDPDLVADLLPRRAEPETGSGAEPTREEPWVRAAREGVDSAAVTQALRQWPLTEHGAPVDTERTRRRMPPAPPLPLAGADARPPRRRRRWPVVVVVLLLLLGGGAAAVVTGRGHLPVLNRVTVPGVSGNTPAQAVQVLEADGLVVVSGAEAYSDVVAKGKVIGTDPGAGSHLHKGDTVRLTVSKGVEQYPVPPLAGTTEQQADQALRAIKMDVHAVRVWSETVTSGTVIRSDPGKGVVLRPGHPVTIFVSKGRQPITARDWVGRQYDAARAALHAQGLRVEKTEEYDDVAPAGQVMAQDPGAGHVFHKHDTITLTVSKGHAPVTVPSDLGGQGTDAATKELQALGFRVAVHHYFPYFGLGFVMKVDNEGEQQPYGSTVTIYIS